MLPQPRNPGGARWAPAPKAPCPGLLNSVGQETLSKMSQRDRKSGKLTKVRPGIYAGNNLLGESAEKTLALNKMLAILWKG